MAKILIIEDDNLIAKIYKTRLSTKGYEVEIAGDGQTALDLIKNYVPHVVLLDIMMPHLDGFEFLEMIQDDPKLSHTAVLIYSNLSNESEVAKAKELGAREYLVKANASPDEVVEKIEKYLPKQ